MNSVINRSIRRVESLTKSNLEVNPEQIVKAVLDELFTTEDVAEPDCRMPFENKVTSWVNYVFGGKDRVAYFAECGGAFIVVPFGSLASYDGAELTRMVMASHRYCLKSEVLVHPSGVKLQIVLTNRIARYGRQTERHPTIEQVLRNSPLSSWTH